MVFKTIHPCDCSSITSLKINSTLLLLHCFIYFSYRQVFLTIKFGWKPFNLKKQCESQFHWDEWESSKQCDQIRSGQVKIGMNWHQRWWGQKNKIEIEIEGGGSPKHGLVKKEKELLYTGLWTPEYFKKVYSGYTSIWRYWYFDNNHKWTPVLTTEGIGILIITIIEHRF